MDTTVEVLKYETLTPRQSHKYVSTDFKFGLGDYVPKFTYRAEYSLDQWWGHTHLVTLVLLFF